MRYRAALHGVGSARRSAVAFQAPRSVFKIFFGFCQESFFSPDEFAPIDLCPTSRRASYV